MSTALISVMIVAFQVTQPAPTTDVTACAVDVSSQIARPWPDFEFSTETPGGPMWLAGRGCYRAAAVISREYLAKGQPLSVREQAITQLHMARNWAYSGDEKAAAQAAASARRSDLRTDQEIPLDWNSYVQGLYAFLVKDRVLLDDNLRRLTTSGRQGDALNGRNLAALANCFDRPYVEAMTDTVCWAVPPVSP